MEQANNKSLKKYARELYGMIEKAAESGDGHRAAYLYHKLLGVRSAAYVIGAHEADEFIGCLLGQLKVLQARLQMQGAWE